MPRRWGSYEDYAQERDDEREKAAHEAGECQEWCPYCADDEEQMSKDVDELAEHINDALDKEQEKK